MHLKYVRSVELLTVQSNTKQKALHDNLIGSLSNKKTKAPFDFRYYFSCSTHGQPFIG